jgi:tRNA A-37 threonylcarbamoyl transferase component Bud32
VRAFAEWRLLEHLTQRGLRVPAPVAAGYQRHGATYRCDLITQRILGTRTLSTVLAAETPADSTWRAIGSAIARLHGQGVNHADLNAHNILLDDSAIISVIDFDRATLRSPGGWTLKNLARLRRSLMKIAADLPAGRFAEANWQQLLAGYRAG